MSLFLVGGKDGLGSRTLAPGDVGCVLFEDGWVRITFKTAEGDRILFHDRTNGKTSESLYVPMGVGKDQADAESERTNVTLFSILLGCAADLHVDHRMTGPHAWEIVFGAKP